MLIALRYLAAAGVSNMALEDYSSRDLLIPHNDLVALRRSGTLYLGIDQRVASQLSLSSAYAPRGNAVRAAFLLYEWLAIAVLVVGICLSFAWKWYAFVPALLLTAIIRRGNKQGNADNILDAAMADEDFYLKVLDLNGWLYRLPPEVAAKYTRQSPNNT